MAIESLLVSALFEAPVQLLAYVLRRCFSMKPEPAYTVAGGLFLALVVGACLVVWFMSGP